ncbi:MAG: DsrE family protein [Haloferacaceae archaeon]
MDEADSDRRRFLASAGAGAAVAIGGCLHGSEGANASTMRTDGATTTAAETETTERQTTEPEPTMSTVFHFSGASSEQKHGVANVSNLLADDSIDLGTAALVANGRGIQLLLEEDSTVADEVRGLLDDGVEFYACHNSMEAFGATEDDLLDSEIEVVPAGVGALTRLQAAEGYAYIKTP